MYDELGDWQKALEYNNQALIRARATGDRSGEAYTLKDIGSTYAHMGERKKAMENYRQALRLYQAEGDHAAEADLLKTIREVGSAKRAKK